jgi:multiple sugar transport system substrate-binding protein
MDLSNKKNSTTLPRLKGSTWGHPRGFAPLISLSQNKPELFAAEVTWDIRTLQQFADHSLVDLANNYDLIILDHPFIGAVSDSNLLIPLDTLLENEYLEDQRRNAVGPAYESYLWNDHVYALPIDVAGHVSAARKDLFDKHNLQKPETWGDVLLLARGLASGSGPKVAVPFIPVDLWCLFVTLCANRGVKPYESQTQVVPHDVGVSVLEYMLELFSYAPKESKQWNPIHLLDEMSTTDNILYCPALFGYSNYSMDGFRNSLVNFGAIPDAGFGSVGGIIGGAGIGISTKSQFPAEAAQIVEVLCSPEIQSSLYAKLGGQPGHRSAWISEGVNQFTNNFYQDTLSTLDNSYLRPRFPRFVDVQSETATILANALYEKTSLSKALLEADELYVRYSHTFFS